MTAEFYGESFIPEAYARTAYADYFELEKFLFDERRQTQPILFFRRKIRWRRSASEGAKR